MNLKEIKKLLKEISLWPWKKYNERGVRTPLRDVGNKSSWSPVIYNGDADDLVIKQLDLDFIAQSPQIVADLVEEVESLTRYHNKALKIIGSTSKQNTIMREALDDAINLIKSIADICNEYEISGPKRVAKGWLNEWIPKVKALEEGE